MKLCITGTFVFELTPAQEAVWHRQERPEGASDADLDAASDLFTELLTSPNAAENFFETDTVYEDPSDKSDEQDTKETMSDISL
jgi:hypothetical protein